MKAKAQLNAKIGGIQYTVNVGETIPPALAEFYAANKAIDSMIAAGAIEEPTVPMTHQTASAPKKKE